VPLQIQKVCGANVWSRASRRELQKYIGPSVNPMAFRSAHSCQTYVVQVFTITVQTESVHDCLDTARVICTLNTCCKDYSLAEPGKALKHRVPQSFVSRMLAETRELQGVCYCQTPWVICALLLSAGWIYNIVSGNLARVSGSYWYEVLGPRSHGCTNIHLTEWIC
jgi:hypothetical protein